MKPIPLYWSEDGLVIFQLKYPFIKTRKECPKCGRLLTEQMKRKNWYRCYYCGRVFV
jgi:DNA-directed RNA polymerase subunit RPC12/RpoP